MTQEYARTGMPAPGLHSDRVTLGNHVQGAGQGRKGEAYQEAGGTSAPTKAVLEQELAYHFISVNKILLEHRHTICLHIALNTTMPRLSKYDINHMTKLKIITLWPL